MKALDLFLQLCRTALDKKQPFKDREAAVTLIRLRSFSKQQLGPDAAEKAEQLKEAILLWWAGRAARDNRPIIFELMQEVAELPDYVPPAEPPKWWQKENA
jgi:hypothetical protein